MLNGRRYEAPFERKRLLRAIGSLLPDSGRPAACKGLPACYNDADCVKPGYVVECVRPGTAKARCVYHKGVRVPVTVLEDSRATHSNSDSIIESFLVFLPGLAVERVDYASRAGRELAAKYKIERLPAYILGPGIKRARKYGRISEMFDKVSGSYVALPALVGSHQFIKRRRAPGRLDVFFAPGSSQGFELVMMAVNASAKLDPRPLVHVRHAVYRDRGKKLAMAGGIAEIEEALRQVVVRERFRGKFHRYLAERGKLPGSSYWRAPLEAAGIDPDEVRRLAASDWAKKSLERDADDLAELATGGPAVFLVGNQEVTPAGKLKDVERILDHLSDQLLRISEPPQAKDDQR